MYSDPKGQRVLESTPPDARVYLKTRYSLLLAISLIIGCSSDGIIVVPVEGTVTLNGKPLDRIMVEFWPESRGQRSIGETDANGHFVLWTDDGKRRGASLGSHLITLKDSAVLGDKFLGRAGETVDMSAGRKSRIPNQYTSPTSTKLSAQVEADSKNVFVLEVE